MKRAALRRLLPAASADLLDLLDGARGAVPPPIRAEIFGPQRFAQHGRSLGLTHQSARVSLRATSFFPRLRSNISVLREAHRYIGTQASTGYDISPAAEWLLDNFHLIEAQLKEIHDGLPRSYFKALPLLQDEPLAGLPRIYGVAWAFVAHTDGAFDDELAAQFLGAYQESAELNLSELWALPTTLRVVLVENLRRLAERVAVNKAGRAVANLCCDQIETYSLEALDDLLALLNQRGVGRVFLAQIAQRLQDRRNTGDSPCPARYEEWLLKALPDLATVGTQQNADQAADNLSVSNAVTSLRVIGDADWPDIIARTSALMRLMLSSPVFEAEHAITRDQTLHGIELLARRSGRSETSVAQTLLGLMQGAERGAEFSTQDQMHGNSYPADAVPAHWLLGAGRPALVQALGLHERTAVLRRALARRLALPAYLGALLLGTIGLVAWLLQHHGANTAVGPGLGWVLLGATLMLLPASETVVALVNRLISESAVPGHLPRFALAQGIPAEHRVMVVIPAMLGSEHAIQDMVHRLELHHLANPEPHAQFALLTDWADADSATTATDEALLASARRQVRALNARHPDFQTDEAPRFILLHRARQFSQTEQRWIGWERKRGKLEQLIAALADGNTAATTAETATATATANSSAPAFLDLGLGSRMAANTRHVLTLDSDTQLPPARLRELVSVAAHPHNQPQLSSDGRRVLRGYGILQPRVVTPLPAPAEFTLYHWLFAGQCGIDPYSAATSEVYQDLFGEGTFTGKGLLNVRALHAVLAGRLPEGQVLSHDLLEGSLARCAAVTDITVVEDAPGHADVAAARVHRWTRGDWQLLPFLLAPGRYPLRTINRWKMFDNLRRSLVAPVSLALLLLALAGLTISPWAALGLVLAAFSAGPLMGAVAGLSPSRDDLAKRHFYRVALADLARALWGGVWLLGQLLQQALMATDAIVRALYRLSISRRHLLQWTTAAAAQASAKTSLPALLRQHWDAPVVALLLLGALWWAVPTSPGWAPALATALCLLWATSPLATWWVSRPSPADPDAALAPAERVYLAGIARDTWRFFERCVGPGDQHLPPDNLQTTPHDMVAHRTSPTNIGLYLLSVACARQFGWIGTQELLARLEATLATLASLQRHCGHFLNWYDTQTTLPLLPMYVSTVDSGNLSGHLLTTAQACLALAGKPYDARAQQAALLAAKARWAPLLARRGKLSATERADLRACLADHRATRRSAAQDALAQAAEVAAVLAQAPALSPPAEVIHDDQERSNVTLGAAHRLRALARRFEQLASEADYAFLYHPKRHLFHLGFRVAEQQLDAGFYDLLASESRLTGLLAIAQGQVPVKHWLALGRPFFAVGSEAGLRSWSGSMFEYLMPSLVLLEPQGSVLHDACHSAIHEQINFGRVQGVPWGISECAYAGSDHTLAYQYAPQGVPRLALRRTPPDELVVAPYATALAAQLAPHLACVNFQALQALGARGPYGFIEALDFSPTRQATAARFTPVNTFMAHHQGMSIVALANVLLDGCAQRWGMANAHIEAVVSLLHERTPREVSDLVAPPSGLATLALQRRAPGLLREVQPGVGAVEPTHLLSNGRYSVALRSNGAGWSRWGNAGITRWRDDALRDAYGSFFYLRPWAGPGQPQGASSPLASITQHPAPDPAAAYQSTFHADRVCFEATWAHLQAHTTVWVSPEDDVEFRQVALHNLSDKTQDIELISAFEVTLADARADEAHPAFSNLFVRALSRGGLPAQGHAEHPVLVFERQPRLATEQGLHMAHFLADNDPQVLSIRSQTDRKRWLGRNHTAALPLAALASGTFENHTFEPALADGSTPPAVTNAPADLAPDSPPSTHQQTGLDPACVLAVRLRLAPHSRAQLTFATAASSDPKTLHAVIDKYSQPSHVKRASLMSATLTGIRLRALALSSDNFAALQTLTTALVLCLTRPHAGQAQALPNVAAPSVDGQTEAPCDRRLLWRFGISGDRPIILVSAGQAQGLGLLRSLAQALRLWAWAGVGCDLVVVNAEPVSYLMALHRDIAALRERHLLGGLDAFQPSAPGAPTSTGFHLLRTDELSPGEMGTLQSLARLRLHADGRPLIHHVQEWAELHELALAQRQDTATTPVRLVAAYLGKTDTTRAAFTTTTAAPTTATHDTAPARPAPVGEFDAATGEFTFDAGARSRPPRPWINVLANPSFGAHLSEGGGGYTWAQNSRMNQLTAWSNDPVADPPAEWFLLQDRKTLQVWSVAPCAWGDEALAYRVVHGQGYSRISHRRGDLEVTATWCVDATTAVKQVRLQLVNHGHRSQQLRLIGIAEWLMGANRADRGTVHTALHRQRLPSVAGAPSDTAQGPAPRGRKLTALMATQRERSAGFGGSTAFLALAGAADEHEDWTCDRRELFDARGRLVLPDHLGQRAGAGLDPCAALSTTVGLPAGASTEQVFLLGWAPSLDAAQQLATLAAATPAEHRLALVSQHWDELLGTSTVKTPDPLFDALVNHWLLYQTISCRLWAKAGFYQAGGATGFRDQLQDTLALAWAAPGMLREQIVLCASRQFAQGDVQHWWHAPLGAGVRTHFSDDLLWLPHACAHYLHATDDAGLLDEQVPFIDGQAIPDGAEDAYYTPTVSTDSASVYEHAARAIDLSLRVGAHGLPLMGTGDWNDGMNRVGHEGRGESVWLGWFLCRLVADFSPIALARGDAARAQRWQVAATGWLAALLGPSWDGQWFKRAFFDNGQPLGSHANTEARIDLIAQAWAVLSKVAPPALQRMAMTAVADHLVDADAGLIKLLDPPLQHAEPSAGYIQAYPPGVRENGGQYTHAGVWALMAQARLAQDQATQTHRDTPPAGPPAEAMGDTVYRFFTYLSPAHRARHPTRGPAYELEPYAVAGDVYSQAPYVGRGGWSWYTGAAAWLHRAALESMLGLQLDAQSLRFRPCLPSHWPKAELTLRRGPRSMHFIFVRGPVQAALDDAAQTCAGVDVSQLLPGERLAWPGLATHTCFVIPLDTPEPAAGVAPAPAPPTSLMA